MQFTKATKKRRKARIALMGPTGAGKTETALRIATGLAPDPRVDDVGGIAVIDTEHGTASLYSDRYDFDVIDLESFAPDRYIEAVKAATAAKYAVLIIDSWSHAWAGTDGILEFVDKKRKHLGANQFTVWGDATPKQNEMVETILRAPLHVLVTMRVKMAYVLEDRAGANGRTTQVPVKKGLQPIQRDGVEYEFDVIMDMDLDHTLTVGKTRCPLLDGRIIQKPTSDLGTELAAWLDDGASIPTISGLEADALRNLIESSGADKGKFMDHYGIATMTELPTSKLEEATRMLEKKAGQRGTHRDAVERPGNGELPLDGKE